MNEQKIRVLQAEIESLKDTNRYRKIEQVQKAYLLVYYI